MDIRQLKTFVILCETLNYQRAASILQYEPSTLHKHIQKLEEELGIQLFVKQGKRLVATERCMEVECYARNILNEYHIMVNGEVSESKGMESITVTGCETKIVLAFDEMLKVFKTMHQGIDMSVPIVRNKDVPDMVRSGMADVGFYYMDTMARIPGLQKIVLYQEPFDIALPKGHPLCEEKILTYEMLSKYPIACVHEDCAPVRELLLRFKKNGITPGLMRNMGNLPSAVKSAHDEMGFMVSGSSTNKRYEREHGFTIRRFEDRIVFYETLLYQDFDSLKPVAKEYVLHTLKHAEKSIAHSGGTLKKVGYL